MIDYKSIIEDEKKLFGFYRGIVLKHLPFGKCKIFVQGVYESTLSNMSDYIPDAEQAAPLFGGCNTGNGTFSYPNIGSTVWCFFANGDQNMPVYFASTLGGDNAFGQYEKIMPARQAYDKDDEDQKLIEESKHSNTHLITSGNTQVQFHESGKLSAIVRYPYQLEASVQHNNDLYQYEKRYDSVNCYPVESSVNSKIVPSINCQNVMDNEKNNGEILLHTFQYDTSADISSTTDINTSNDIILNNMNNILLSAQTRTNKAITDPYTLPFAIKDGKSSISINTLDSTGIHESSIDNISDCSIDVNKNTNKELINIKITDSSGVSKTNFSRIYLDKYGTIYIEGTKSIVLKAKTISIDAEQQLDINGTTILMNSKVNTSIKAPAVNIDTSNGNTKITSRRGMTIL